LAPGAIEPPELIGGGDATLSRLELCAGHPKRTIGKGLVHVVAVVGQGLPRVGLGPEEPAVHTSTRDLDAPATLKRENESNQDSLERRSIRGGQVPEGFLKVVSENRFARPDLRPHRETNCPSIPRILASDREPAPNQSS